MNQQEILRKIGGIIAELKEQHTYLEANSSSFNDLELELFTANANFLIDHTEILKKIHNQANLAAATIVTPEKLYPTKPVILDYFSEEEQLPFADDPLLKKLNNIPPTKSPEPKQSQFSEQEPEKDETFILPEIAQEDEPPASFMIADTSFTAQKSVPPEEVPAPFMIADTSFTAQKSVPPEEVPTPFIIADTSFTAQKSVSPEEVPTPFMIADTSFTAQKSVPAEKKKVEENTFEKQEVEPVNVIETKPEIQHPQESTKPELVFAEPAKPEPAKPEPIQQTFIKPEITKPEVEPVLTLNQRIAAQKSLGQPVAKAVVAGKSVQDLPSLISLNDKLLFVKELFNGYNLAYSEAVNILNRYTNFEQAEQFLKINYATKNNWKDKPATSERFYDLLKKRFS